MAGIERVESKWSTWEDLILVCLVKKHGLQSWDKISMEFPHHALDDPPRFLTPHESMSRFTTLYHQFLLIQPPQTTNDDQDKMLESMKEEYKKIRIEDLRQQIERLDSEIEVREAALAAATAAPAAAVVMPKESGKTGKTADGVAVVEANEDSDIQPTKADGANGGGADNKSGQVLELNEPDPVGEKGGNSGLNDKKTMDRVLKRLKRRKRSKLLYQKLRNQKDTKFYKNLIREHMDLDLIQSKIKQKEDIYSFSSFFRDLLLMFNNAIVFYDKDSQEWITATQMREDVRKEMEKINLF